MSDQRITKALIVAAGLGMRLRPATATIPKALLEVGGTPLIRRSVDILNRYGVTDVNVVVGYRQCQIRRELGERANYIVNLDYEATNNMASMHLGWPAVAGQPFLYLHSDLWYSPEIIEIALNQPGDVCFLVEQKLCGDEEMKVRVEKGLLVEADKAIPPAQARGEWLGITKFEPAGAAIYLAEVEKALTRSRTLYDCAVVSDLARQGVPLNYADIGKLSWAEIDTPEDLAYAQDLAQKEGS
jgi:choline kinase